MKVFDKFTKYALTYMDASIYDVYNAFIANGKISKQEKQFAIDHCMLMLKVGETARGSIPSVQKILS